MNDLSDVPTIGHNKPPVAIAETLAEKYKRELDQAAELKEAALDAPARIDDDATEAKVSELVLKLRGLEGALDAAQKAERKPYNQTVKEINGFFMTKIEPLQDWQTKLKSRSGDYLERKAAAERRRLAEEAERLRQEADAKLREAEESERRQREAEARRQEEERKARAAEEAKQKAIEDRKRAEEAAERARQESIRLAEERKRMEAEEVERRKLKQEQDEQERIAHEARLAAQREAEEKAKADRQKADEEAAASRRKADEERAKQRAAEEAAAAAKREEKTASRDSRDALQAAERGDNRAARIEQKADGPVADLARTRSEHGAVATVQRNWVCRVVDRNKLDKEALWNLIDGDAIEVALRKWMLLQPTTAEARRMAGAEMEIETTAQIR